MHATAWALATLFPFPVATRAEIPTEAWVRNHSGSSVARANVLAVDANDNVFVTGYCQTSASQFDYATIKYSRAGMPLWTNYYNGPGHKEDIAQAIVIDRDHSVIVTGYSTGAGSMEDFATIKYSNAGVALWTNRYNGTGNSSDSAVAVAVDGGNNVIVTGSSPGSGSSTDFASIKYSAAGVPLWTNRYNGPGNSYNAAVSVAVDKDDNVMVTGTSTGGESIDDIATIKYSSAGIPVWTNRFGEPMGTDAEARAVRTDADGNVIVAGTVSGYPGGRDFATVQYSSSGLPLWTNYYNGPTSDADTVFGLAVGADNCVTVTGSTSSTNTDYATIQYSSAGAPLWTNLFNGTGNSADIPQAIVVDADNNVIVTGRSDDSIGTPGCGTVQYSSAGIPLWSMRFAGFSAITGKAVAVDGRNNVIVTGGSSAGIVTVKYVYCLPAIFAACRPVVGGFQLLLEEVYPPGRTRIEGSSNLADWIPLFTNNTSTNVFTYTDPMTGQHPQRFYRAALQP